MMRGSTCIVIEAGGQHDWVARDGDGSEGKRMTEEKLFRFCRVSEFIVAEVDDFELLESREF